MSLQRLQSIVNDAIRTQNKIRRDGLLITKCVSGGANSPYWRTANELSTTHRLLNTWWLDNTSWLTSMDDGQEVGSWQRRGGGHFWDWKRRLRNAQNLHKHSPSCVTECVYFQPNCQLRDPPIAPTMSLRQLCTKYANTSAPQNGSKGGGLALADIFGQSGCLTLENLASCNFVSCSVWYCSWSPIAAINACTGNIGSRKPTTIHKGKKTLWNPIHNVQSKRWKSWEHMHFLNIPHFAVVSVNKPVFTVASSCVLHKSSTRLTHTEHTSSRSTALEALLVKVLLLLAIFWMLQDKDTNHHTRSQSTHTKKHTLPRVYFSGPTFLLLAEISLDRGVPPPS